MNTELAAALLGALVVIVLGVLILLGYIVKVCVGKARSQDVPVILDRIPPVVRELCSFIPRRQGAQQLVAAWNPSARGAAAQLTVLPESVPTADGQNPEGVR
ncbi:hypothetical protein [Kitasatospora sp. NPDC059571]|uniref:hypothetical protein n=1 Tax=Kitasatospora sp. NPDC059571 TaxID=3346871 RepID=UPI0036855620